MSNAEGVRISGNTFDGPDDVPAVTIDRARDVTIDVVGAARPIVAVSAGTDRASVRLAAQILVAHAASAGFSSKQGDAQWRYRSWNGARYQDLSYDAAAALWGAAGQVLVARDRQAPGAAADAVRSWTADQDGDIRITGRARKTGAGGDGVRVETVHVAETIWSTEIAGDDLGGVTHDVTRRVRKGDEIHFRVGRRVNFQFDSTAWDPRILLTP